MRAAAAIAMLALLPLSVSFADVYRSVDAQGHVLYSDTPTPGAELVKISNSSQHFSSLSSSSSAPKAAAPPPPQVKTADSSHDQQARDEAKRTVATDEAQTRADQCKKASDTYQANLAARRIYSQNADGERTYLSDADAEQARVNAKLAMDEACGN